MADSTPTPNDTPERPFKSPTGTAPEPADTSPRPAAEAVGGDGASPEAAAEENLWAGRTHWKHYAGRLLLWLAGNIAVMVLLAWAANRFEWLTGQAAFWAVLIVLLVSGTLVVGRILLTIIGHRYRLTTQRLFVERGILSQTVDQTELIRVDDVRLYKSLLDRLFGVGTVAVMSTDASDREILIAGIPEPEKVAEAIRTRMRTMRRKSLFIENL